MSLGNDRSKVARFQKEVADLQRKQSNEVKKVADASKKMNAAVASANKASTASMAKSYLSTAERESRNAQTAQDKQAQISSDIAKKMTELARTQEIVSKGEEKERKDQASANEKLREIDTSSIKALQSQNERLSKDLVSLAVQMTAAIDKQASETARFAVENADGSDNPYDFFLSHAWKDKADFVDGLAFKAAAVGLNVWYDRQALRWGDSIRQRIDEGLRRSFFGVVVLSPNFFERPWPQVELDAIVQKDLSGRGRLLPIWHKLTQDEVANHAPTLAGRLALNTSNYSTDAIVEELLLMRDSFRSAADVS